MLDLKTIRNDPEAVERGLADKGTADAAGLVQNILRHDESRRIILGRVEHFKMERNNVSAAIAVAQRQGQDVSAQMADARALGERIKNLEVELKQVEDGIERELEQIPNLPHATVPRGKSDAENVEVRQWGTPRAFAFPPKPHEEVGKTLGLLDLERAARMAKARFAILWGPLARLSHALARFMVDLHTREHGYTELWLPHLVNGETMLRTGQLPKFEEGLFKTVEADEGRTLYLIPTAEVPLTAIHFDETLPEAALPRRYTAYTPSYRREAGTYGKDMKGIYRQHQFDKVELVKIATPAQADAELESMVDDAEEVLRRLSLPYRVVERCVGDLGFSAAKGYDIEVWRPAAGKYTEISSCSNYGTFGGRRGGIRYKPGGGGKTEFCATLNGSGLAVGRTLIAVLENYQEADGTVTVPAAVRPYMGGVERLTPVR